MIFGKKGLSNLTRVGRGDKRKIKTLFGIFTESNLAGYNSDYPKENLKTNKWVLVYQHLVGIWNRRSIKRLKIFVTIRTGTQVL